MTAFYKCEYFIIQELVSKVMFDRYGEQCWQFFNPAMLITADLLRKVFGVTYVNDWHKGGDNHYKGLRGIDCEIGATASIHRIGGALDSKFKNVSGREAREYIMKNQDDSSFRLITAIEMHVSHLHWDCRNRNRTHGILPVYPTQDG